MFAKNGKKMRLKPKKGCFWNAYCKFGNVVQNSVLDPKKSFLSLGKFNTTRGAQNVMS